MLEASLCDTLCAHQAGGSESGLSSAIFCSVRTAGAVLGAGAHLRSLPCFIDCFLILRSGLNALNEQCASAPNWFHSAAGYPLSTPVTHLNLIILCFTCSFETEMRRAAPSRIRGVVRKNMVKKAYRTQGHADRASSRTAEHDGAEISGSMISAFIVETISVSQDWTLGQESMPQGPLLHVAASCSGASGNWR